jgi:hypothetical protein
MSFDIQPKPKLAKPKRFEFGACLIINVIWDDGKHLDEAKFQFSSKVTKITGNGKQKYPSKLEGFSQNS